MNSREMAYSKQAKAAHQERALDTGAIQVSWRLVDAQWRGVEGWAKISDLRRGCHQSEEWGEQQRRHTALLQPSRVSGKGGALLCKNMGRMKWHTHTF